VAKKKVAEKKADPAKKVAPVKYVAPWPGAVVKPAQSPARPLTRSTYPGSAAAPSSHRAAPRLFG
jgi:hypothetical protein